MPLTDTRLRALKPKDKPYKVTDERGLYVEVTPTGSKLWRFRYRIGGAQKKLCIGSYPDISLKQARDEAYEARRAVASGGDPAFEKRKRKIRAEFLSAQTFEAVAREYIEQMMVQNGRADGTIVKANYFLDKLAPAIGNRPIHEIEPFEVLAPLKRLEATGKHETAKKCRSFAGRVFRYGVATTRCKSDPTSMLKGALVTPRATHYAAILEPTELGGLLRAIDDFTGYMVTKLALQIAPHVFVRPGELRHAEWHEIDLVDGIWKIPAGKMKARRAHAVPLSKQVRGYLTDLAEMLGREGYVFPSARSSKRPMSENTLNAAFRRMGYASQLLGGAKKLGSALATESDKIKSLKRDNWLPDEIASEIADEIPTTLELIASLNRRRNDAIQNVLGVSAQGLKTLFRKVRQALATRDMRLVLLLEDITSWEGLDDSLIDVLVFNATARGDEAEQDVCPLISVVGLTPAYYRQLQAN